jgi:P-type Mg2+ transporter
VIIVTSLVGCVALAVPYLPRVHSALRMMPPLPEYYGFLVAILVSYMLLVQVVKTIYQRIFNDWL